MVHRCLTMHDAGADTSPHHGRWDGKPMPSPRKGQPHATTDFPGGPAPGLDIADKLPHWPARGAFAYATFACYAGFPMHRGVVTALLREGGMLDA